MRLLDGTHYPHNIATYAFGIGAVFGVGFSILTMLGPRSDWFWMGVFVTALAVFHIAEYLVTAMYNYPKLSLESFLIPHSKSYTAANTVAVVEYIVYLAWFPWITASIPTTVRLSGFFLILVGQFMRSYSMIHAGTNFSHQIEYHKRRTHELVTSGPYALMRHPSYFAFYWWGIGSQLLLGNPVSLVGYALALTWFFKERIEYEEQLLVHFFGDEYIAYRKRVGVWIPFTG
ncbi:protein-S-isoprenylcysteine O-methyltransferase [Catenaria anguillulae PL171]|uniref:Protein-S-isoprenylcysteine O-methyltransferase n=1 Tax=Catenaria anguillulae PL171 TaxID=765915 RepID=A0A1Y2HEX6_9FUNG|nr:protein-S-isoprenylcysteine O-methyltransferase [Catenaria anguillulae PL171]